MSGVLLRAIYNGKTFAFAPRYVISYAFVLFFTYLILLVLSSPYRDIISHISYTTAIIDQLRPLDHDRYTYHFRIGYHYYSGMSFATHAFDARKKIVVPKKGDTISIAYASDNPWNSITWDPKIAENELLYDAMIPSTLVSLLLVSFLENLFVVLLNIKNGKQ